MKIVTKSVVAALILVAGVAVAKEGVQDPTVKARMDLMGTIGMNTKILGDMAGGKTAFDADAAGTARSALAVAAGDIGKLFEPQAGDPVSDAKPEIWTDWETFVTKSRALVDAAVAMDTTSAASIGAGMGAVGGSCQDCHKSFRM